MRKSKYTFKSEVWVYPGMAAWRFVSLPKKESEKIKTDYAKSARGWGSLPVTATIGKTSWKTSIFPDKKSGTYLLPLKSEVRKKEGIYDQDKVTVHIKIRL
jgi:hypothetical protein